ARMMVRGSIPAKSRSESMLRTRAWFRALRPGYPQWTSIISSCVGLLRYRELNGWRHSHYSPVARCSSDRRMERYTPWTPAVAVFIGHFKLLHKFAVLRSFWKAKLGDLNHSFSSATVLPTFMRLMRRRGGNGGMSK